MYLRFQSSFLFQCRLPIQTRSRFSPPVKFDSFSTVQVGKDICGPFGEYRSSPGNTRGKVPTRYGTISREKARTVNCHVVMWVPESISI